MMLAAKVGKEYNKSYAKYAIFYAKYANQYVK
jgi:hypothetical protein